MGEAPLPGSAGSAGLDPRVLTPQGARARFRAGLAVPTAGYAAGFCQANLVVLARDAAAEFEQFARRNPKPCPVLDITGPGSPVSRLAPGADLRTDLPGYRVWEHGTCVAEPGDVTGYWQDDFVAFLLGCSFTFERALLAAGVPIRHLEQGGNVPMFITDRQCQPAGRFSGPLVVSMRPVPAGLVATAEAVTARCPAAHGAPVHIGDPAALGVADVSRPDFGDPVVLEAGDVPVFWACGVTPQVALASAGLPLAITHAPGHMFITDIADTDLVTVTGLSRRRRAGAASHHVHLGCRDLPIVFVSSPDLPADCRQRYLHSQVGKRWYRSGHIAGGPALTPRTQKRAARPSLVRRRLPV